MESPATKFAFKGPASPELTEAMKSAQQAAVNANEKVFPIFAAKLASRDIMDYANTTQKLTTWLNSEKAYYPAARPKIVELLEIAHLAFTNTFVRHFAVTDVAGILQGLVRTVTPFIPLFTETELHVRLLRVIADTEEAVSANINNAPPAAITIPPPPSLVSPVHIDPQPRVPPPTPGPPTSSLQIQTSLSLVTVSAFNPAEVMPGQTDAKTTLVSPLASTAQAHGGNISPSVSFKPQPKRARRAEIPGELVARDLDWFKANQASTVVTEETGAPPPPKPVEPLPAATSDAAHIPGPSPSSRKKTARMVPSRRFPRPVSHDALMGVGSNVSASTSPPGSEPPAEAVRAFNDADVQNVNGKKSSPERTETGAQSALMESMRDVQKVSAHNDLSFEEAFLSARLPAENDHEAHLVKAPRANGQHAETSRSSTSRIGTTFDGLESMDISASDLGSEAGLPEPRFKLEFTPPQTPQVLRFKSPVLPPLVTDWEPPLNLNFDISSQLEASATDSNEPRFGDRMTVIHSTQGKAFTHAHIVDMNLNESMFSKISKWANRKFHPLEALHGVCISLGCYRLPEFFERIRSGNSQPDIQALTARSPCSWPHSNQLSLYVNGETRRTVVTLSPPIFLTSDQCVDISSLLRHGHNKLEIRQQDDLSEYVVVFHAHRPSRAQLAELDAIKIVDERWERFLDVLSGRVAPGKVQAAGVVGV